MPEMLEYIKAVLPDCAPLVRPVFQMNRRPGTRACFQKMDCVPWQGENLLGGQGEHPCGTALDLPNHLTTASRGN